MSPENEKPVLIVSAIFIIFTAFAAAGCRTGNDDEKNDLCPEGYRAEGSACIPIFDDPEDCPGPNEMPALGGGCRPVGVLECAEGFVKDSDGGCEPILPDHECPPGAMEVIGETECCPVGVIECGEGFVSDGQGGCDAILPPGPDPCPPGTIEQIGHDTCQPLGDCGPDPSEGGSPWGNIQVDGTTVFVDGASDADEPDGTQNAPYPTVAAALQAVEPGGQVAIAAGNYREGLVLNKSVRLTGRCSRMVTLLGLVDYGTPFSALLIGPGGSGSVVRGVTLSGPHHGLVTYGAQGVLMEEVEVRDNGRFGVFATNRGDVLFRKVKVANATMFGLYTRDSMLSLEQSVVQGTLPCPDTDEWGRGIDVICDSDEEICGSLIVENSLVTDNKEYGIYLTGVDSTIVSSVIRDTQSQSANQIAGMGIGADCDPDMKVCGRLRVEGSLVSGNRFLGIAIRNVDTLIHSSVVRDTLHHGRQQEYGRGIEVFCEPDLGMCGTLIVEESLVAGNLEVGINSAGAETRVLSSIIRDTLPQTNSKDSGRGIGGQCFPQAQVCGSLWVENSLVTGNHEIGIGVVGLETTVISSVVRDTLPQESDQSQGGGIGAACHPFERTCGSLRVEKSLVAGNRATGIFSDGVETTVISSVVRDTLPQESDQRLGRGIYSGCSDSFGICGSLWVKNSLVNGNREMGIAAVGIDTTVISSVVRDTLPQESDQSLGGGIGAECDYRFDKCGSLWVEESTVMGNRTAGIFVFGVDTTVVSSIVRDTLPQESDHGFGRGINAQCGEETGSCGSLWVIDSQVASNENVGMAILGVPANLQGVMVYNTSPNLEGDMQGVDGQGVYSGCDPFVDVCGTLSMNHCMVVSSYSVGVAVEEVYGSMTGSVVENVFARPKDGKYGYGVQIRGQDDEMPGQFPVFHVRDSEIRDAGLAGLFYHFSTGDLTGSVVSGGEYSVAINRGASPSIAENNVLSGTVEDDPKAVELTPSPAPMPAMPME